MTNTVTPGAPGNGGGQDAPANVERRPTVTIYGAGIAGLTAAHELAERGFDVRVVERERAYDARGVLRMAIGGAARTHYAEARHVTRGQQLPLQCRSEPRQSGAPRGAADTCDVTITVSFRANAHWLDPYERVKLARRLDWIFSHLPPAQRIEVEGYCAPEDQQDRTDQLATQRAEAVRVAFEEAFREHPATSRSPAPVCALKPPGQPPRKSPQSSPSADQHGTRTIPIELSPDGRSLHNASAVEAWLRAYLRSPPATPALVLEATVGRVGHDEAHARALAERHLQAAKASLWQLLQAQVGAGRELSLRFAGRVRFDPSSSDIRLVLGSSVTTAVMDPEGSSAKGAPQPGATLCITFGERTREFKEPRPLVVEFAPGEKQPLDRVAESSYLEWRSVLEHLDPGNSYRVRITGFVDATDVAGFGDGDQSDQKLAEARADAVKRLLQADGTSFAIEFEPPRWGSRGEQAFASFAHSVGHNRVALVEVRPRLLPGEHGFRFFPSYYNHVFDTMRRIPIFDGRGQPTGRTVYDNVMPTPNQGVAQRGLNPLILPRSPPESAYERQERLSALRDLGYTPLDVLQFMLRTLRYMSTCSKRRAAELEAISWWDYLRGYDPTTGKSRYAFSERFERDIATQSRTLASFDAVWGDARTCGNTWVQLFYNWLQPAAKVDGTLNGPTSEAWLEPWKSYLRKLGVDFVEGSLLRVELEEQDGQTRLTPFVWIPGQAHDARDPGHGEAGSEYYVIATDAKTAEEVTRDLVEDPSGAGRIGVPQGLDGFTTRVRPAPPDEGPGRVRTPPGKYSLEPWDRFQTMSGIQFFFEEEFKLNDGYVYFNKAAWALTSINSAQFWTRRPRTDRDGYASLLSVDLCDWNARADGGAVVGKSMWECTAPEIADEVLRQIVSEIRLATPLAERDEAWSTGLPPKPKWFHIDSNIEFATEPPDLGRPIRNRTPYLVPIKGDWHNRPGARPWDPSPMAFNALPDCPEEKRKRGEWQAKHGGYLVHWGKLVFAGVYLKTFTRMSTMEAANESGRHAANAILDHWLATHADAWSDPGRPGHRARAAEDGEERIEEARHMRSSVFYTATPRGDYAKIWNPERWEMPDLMLAKQYDEWCFDRGLPHPWDIWGVEALPTLLSQTINAKISGAAPNRLGASIPDSLEAAMEGLLRLAYPEGGWDAMLDVLRQVRRAIDEQMHVAARGERGEPSR